jgi:hypothetical protein
VNNLVARLSYQNQNILNIQPVWPFEINIEWMIIGRTIMSVTSNPDFLTGEGRINGIGDTTISAFFSPKKSAFTVFVSEAITSQGDAITG